MLTGLATIVAAALLLIGIGFVVLRRRTADTPTANSCDRCQTVNIPRHNETGTDWRYRP